MKKLKTRKAWAGFTSGKMDLDLSVPPDDKAHDGYCLLYRTRKDARRFYQDVRRVEIRELPSGRT